MNSIHGTIVNRIRVCVDGFNGKVEVFSSGRAYEEVQLKGVTKHATWFDAASLGRAAYSEEALDDYAKSMTGTVAAGH